MIIAARKGNSKMVSLLLEAGANPDIQNKVCAVSYSTFLFFLFIATLFRVVFCIINPRRACTARVAVYSWFVCLCVDAYSGTTGYEAAY